MRLTCCDATMEWMEIGNCGVMYREAHRGSEKEGGTKRHFRPPEDSLRHKRGCDGTVGCVA